MCACQKTAAIFDCKIKGLQHYLHVNCTIFGSRRTPLLDCMFFFRCDRVNAFGQGERTGRWNRPVLHCANEANVVTEDDTVDGDATDDESETDLEATANDTIGSDGDTEDEPEDVEWIKQQPLPYPFVSTQGVDLLRLVAKWNDGQIW